MESPKLLKALLVLAMILGIVGWLGYRALKNSENPTRLIFKWILTIAIGALIFYKVIPLAMHSPFIGIPLAAACAVVLAIIWGRDVGELMANVFTGLYDGGDQQIESRPIYSRAEKLRMQGHFHEAIVEVRSQLAKFPGDFSGQMLLADIYATNLQDLQSAEIAVEKIASQSNLTPSQIAGAYHSLADWHLQLAQDPDSARMILEKVIARFPDSSFSQTASQRIAHLASTESLLEKHERTKLVAKHFDPYSIPKEQTKTADELMQDAAKRAEDCLKHLEKHPHDSEAREKLATIYALDYQRLDLATQQIEELVGQPNRRPREVARWLNLLADFQIQIGNDIAAAKESIQRIQQMFPSSAFAEQATTRLEYLRAQAKRNEKTSNVKLGSYEKYVGLKKSAD